MQKTKLMTNSIKSIEKKITVSGQQLETANQFKYLEAILSEDGSKTEVLARAAQTAAAPAKLKSMRKDKNISLSTKLKRLHACISPVNLLICIRDMYNKSRTAGKNPSRGNEMS